MAGQSPSQESYAIPLTVVAGYLGAGKTTLINHVLRDAGGERVAVLVNDFGDINIDAALIENADGTTMRLANGCVCCSVGDDLAGALIAIAEEAPGFDRVMIEASGVAHPDKVARYAEVDTRFELAGRVVLVDGSDIKARVQDKFVGRTVDTQLKSADLFVVNKTDLLSDEKTSSVVSLLAARAPGVPVIRAVRGEVPLDFLAEMMTTSSDRSERPVDGAHDHFHTWSFADSAVAGVEQLAGLFENLPESVVRAKALIGCRSGTGYAVHLAGGSVSVDQISSCAAGTRAVFIADSRNADWKAIEADLISVLKLQDD